MWDFTQGNRYHNSPIQVKVIAWIFVLQVCQIRSEGQRERFLKNQWSSLTVSSFWCQSGIPAVLYLCRLPLSPTFEMMTRDQCRKGNQSILSSFVTFEVFKNQSHSHFFIPLDEVVLLSYSLRLHTFQKNCQWQFFWKKLKFLAIFCEKMSSFWQFFDSQMAIFRRVRYKYKNQYLLAFSSSVNSSVSSSLSSPKHANLSIFQKFYL